MHAALSASVAGWRAHERAGVLVAVQADAEPWIRRVMTADPGSIILAGAFSSGPDAVLAVLIRRPEDDPRGSRSAIVWVSRDGRTLRTATDTSAVLDTSSYLGDADGEPCVVNGDVPWMFSGDEDAISRGLRLWRSSRSASRAPSLTA